MLIAARKFYFVSETISTKIDLQLTVSEIYNFTCQWKACGLNRVTCKAIEPQCTKLSLFYLFNARDFTCE